MVRLPFGLTAKIKNNIIKIEKVRLKLLIKEIIIKFVNIINGQISLHIKEFVDSNIDFLNGDKTVALDLLTLKLVR